VVWSLDILQGSKPLSNGAASAGGDLPAPDQNFREFRAPKAETETPQT
jgi:hypothetical protein